MLRASNQLLFQRARFREILPQRFEQNQLHVRVAQVIERVEAFLKVLRNFFSGAAQ